MKRILFLLAALPLCPLPQTVRAAPRNPFAGAFAHPAPRSPQTMTAYTAPVWPNLGADLNASGAQNLAVINDLLAITAQAEAMLNRQDAALFMPSTGIMDRLAAAEAKIAQLLAAIPQPPSGQATTLANPAITGGWSPCPAPNTNLICQTTAGLLATFAANLPAGDHKITVTGAGPGTLVVYVNGKPTSTTIAFSNSLAPVTATVSSAVAIASLGLFWKDNWDNVQNTITVQ
jgi:hypothetical protein